MHPTLASPPPVATPRPSALASRIVWGLAVALLAAHLLTASRYGIFRDEMYGLVCAAHLDWGYVDHPPGGIVITWLAHHLFGDSLLGLRLLPALAGAALVLVTGRLTRELGGSTFAQAVAALAVCVTPVYLAFDHLLMMNAFEPLIWMGCVYCVMRATRPEGGLWWFGFGALAGIGFETKYSIAFLVVGVLCGLALTPQRRHLADWQLWAGLAVCGLIALPNFLWQWQHGFPFLEFRRHVAENHRDVIRGPVAFIVDQMLVMGPMAAPLWVAGVIWLLTGRRREHDAVFGWLYLVVLGAFIALKGKNYYVTPAYPVLFAAGAVALEQFTAEADRRWLRRAYPGLVAAAGVVLAPLALPILPPAALIRYEHWLHLSPPEFEHQRNGPLPQYFADEFGWEEMVREVARVYHALPADERPRTVIFSNSWGAAAAVDFFGPRYGLPHAISKNNSYWLWGSGAPGDVYIVLHTDGVGDRRYFASVEKAGHVEHPYSRRDEWYDIYVCRGLNFDLRARWPEMKAFD